jgi:hypothetical protein
MIRLTEISPIRAPISPGFSPALWKNPVEPSISVRVENTPDYSPVSQNTAGLHLTGWLVKPFKPSFFVPPSLSHQHQQTLPEREYEAIFFSDGDLGFNPGTRKNILSCTPTSPSETFCCDVFPTPKMTLIREKTTLLFSECSILSPIWLSGAESTQKITANSTYWEAKLSGAGGVARSTGKEPLFSRSIIPVRDPK